MKMTNCSCLKYFYCSDDCMIFKWTFSKFSLHYKGFFSYTCTVVVHEFQNFCLCIYIFKILTA